MKYNVGDKVRYKLIPDRVYEVASDGRAYHEDGRYLSMNRSPEDYELVSTQTHEEVEEILQAVLDGTYEEDDHEEAKFKVGDYDSVNHPSHYGQGKIEAIDYIEDILSREEYIGYLRGNIAKYSHRWRYKGGVEDLEKSRWYLDRLIETVRKE